MKEENEQLKRQTEEQYYIIDKLKRKNKEKTLIIKGIIVEEIEKKGNHRICKIIENLDNAVDGTRRIGK